jgi:hypothetical protein
MTSKAFGLAQLGNAYADGALSNRNKIINGAMTIDQRNAGAAVTAYFDYPVDRFQVARGAGTEDATFSAQQDSDVPSGAGFTKSLKFTVTGAETSFGADERVDIRQRVEGFNVADFGFGAAGASSVTLSFWVRSSLTGTFGGSFQNSAANRSYPYTYTISAANTWEYKVVTVSGDTSGTWVKDSGNGLTIFWSLGVGSNRVGTSGAWNANNNTGATSQVQLASTNGATFYLTGVQLEAGDTATPFEHRSYGAELALCQRYFQQLGGNSAEIHAHTLWTYSTIDGSSYVFFPTPMRASPTCTVVGAPNNVSGGTVLSANWSIFYNGAWRGCNVISLSTQSQTGVRLDAISIDSMVGGGAAGLYGGNQCNLIFSAEL